MNESNKSIGEKDLTVAIGILGLIALVFVGAIAASINIRIAEDLGVRPAHRGVGQAPPTRPALRAGRVLSGEDLPSARVGETLVRAISPCVDIYEISMLCGGFSTRA